ncbi:MAG: TadE/TadG family type IV pilus assembly protein [Hyphomicrobiaceae bacterium]
MQLKNATPILRDCQGSIAILTAVTLVVIAGAAGFAITYSSVNHDVLAHQNALDAAVLAGARGDDSTTNDDRIALAQHVFASNIKMSSFGVGPQSLDEASNGPTFLIDNEIITGRIITNTKNWFSGLFGEGVIRVPINSAAKFPSNDPVCVLALTPSSPKGIEIYGTASFTARNCAAQSNSSDGLGLQQYGAATAQAKRFAVKGGYSGAGFTPRPVTGVAPLADPYASIPVPPTGQCEDIASKLINTPAVLTPGTYCGGIRIMANSEIIMQPGIYVMLDGPFRVDSNSTVTGSDVVIAFTGRDSTLYLGSGAIIDLTSPRSGTYKNIQFFQDKDASEDSWVTILGNVRLTFDGAMYFPTQDVWIGGGSKITATSPSYIIVAEKLWFQDNSIIDVWQENRRGLDIAEPLAFITTGVALVR